MIYEHPHKYKEFLYLSTNRMHRLQDVYSLLTKSMCRNDERMALYAAQQIPYPKLLKKQLMIFVCEFVPNFHALCMIYNINAKKERYKLEEWVVKLCRLIKTRIVCNAFRVVSIEPANPDPKVSINDVKFLYQPYQNEHFLTDSELDNEINSLPEQVQNDAEDASLKSEIEEEEIDEAFKSEITDNKEPESIDELVKTIVDVKYVPAVTLEEEKLLINNAYTIFKLVCRDGYKKTIKSIIASIDEHMLRGFKRGTAYQIYRYINKRSLDIIFIYLSLTSLKLATSIDHLGFNNVINPSIYNNIPEFIQLPDYVFDADAMAPMNASYKYYIDNLIMTPTTEPTKTDKFGIQKFIQISQPLNITATQNINIKNINEIYIARIEGVTAIALCSTHKSTSSSGRKYKHIIHMRPVREKSLMLKYVIADYIKSKLLLPFTNRRIYHYHDKYYIVEDTMFKDLDPDKFSKDFMNRTVYSTSVKSFFISDISHYIDEEDLMIKLFKMIIYYRMIGCHRLSQLSIAIINGNVYSFTDAVWLEYPNTIFTPTCNKRVEKIWKQAIDRYWNRISSSIKRYIKVIESDKVVSITCRIIFIHELLKLLDKNNWKFFDPNGVRTITRGLQT